MELYEELLITLLQKGHVQIVFPDGLDPKELIEGECYKALREVKAIICDKALDDGDCFAKIEEVVTLFEKKGIACGGRHDFG